MIKKIYKYQIDVGNLTVDMPEYAEILSVQVQRGVICIWALGDPEQPLRKRTFDIFGTGHDIQCNGGIERIHIGTVQFNGGDLVLHVFETL